MNNPTTDKGRKFAEDEADFIDSQLDNPTTGEWTWEQEGTSVLVSVDEENGDRCYFHCTAERWAKLAVESHNAALAAERERAEFAEVDACELRQQLDAATARELHSYDVAKQCRDELAVAVEALKWYAVATYPDDGSGRPPGAFQRKAKAALAKIGGKTDAYKCEKCGAALGWFEPRICDKCNPTTGAPLCALCGQEPHPDTLGHPYKPVPTTGEWTAVFEENSSCWYICAGKNGEPIIDWPLDSRDLAFQICSAHNAALAAEQKETDLWKRQQAFESKHREKYRGRNIEDSKTLKQLREQLAAANKTAFQAQEMAKEISEQLAGLVEALKGIANSEAEYASTYKAKAKLALARIGGK